MQEESTELEDSDFVGKTEYVQLLLWVIILAIPTALLTLIYLTLYEQGIRLYEYLAESIGIPKPLFTILVATFGGLLVGLGLRYLGERHSESLQDQMAAGRVPYRGLPGLMLVALVSLISGASLGPEAPLGHMGAGLGSWLAERRSYPPAKARVMSLAGISAAFGGFLGTPLSAAFMSMEFTRLLTMPIYTNLVAATVASIIGALIIFSFTGLPPAGSPGFPPEGLLTVPGLIYAVCFGLVGLGWAFLFKFIFGTMKSLTAPLDHYPVLKPVVGGLIFGLVGAWLPLTLFSGEEQLGHILVNGAEIGVFMLLVLAIIKLITLTICLATGFPGGFVFPLFFSGGALGYAIHLILPFIPLPVCIVGMLAGIGGGLMRMPFATILLLLVLGNPTLLPVAALAAITSFLSASILDAGSARQALRQSTEERRETYT